MLLNILRGFTPQAALDAPRFCISAGSPETQSADTGKPGDINSEVYIEEGIPDEVLEELRGECYLMIMGYSAWLIIWRIAMGHDARRASGLSRGMLGRGQVIQKIVDQSGSTVWAAGSDLRADGHAAAQI